MSNIIWFDIDNLPHVSLFRPVFAKLGKKSVEYIITARDFNHTLEQLRYWNIEHIPIGRHGGKNKSLKIINWLYRARQLENFFKHQDIPKLAVSHGSRTQVLAAKKIGIRSLTMMDYEYTESKIFNYLSNYLLLPVYIPDKRLKDAGFNLKKVIRYHGFKEHIYINGFRPDALFRSVIGVSNKEILATIRPPSIVGNYHNKRSELFLITCLKYLSKFENVHCLIINRTKEDRELIKSKINHNENIHFLDKPVDGLQLIWNSDLVISGGGTMNRESAILGTPTYSIFTGRKPYLDEYLDERNKLKFIEKEEDIFCIPVVKRNRNIINSYDFQDVVNEVTDILISKMKN